jgi:KUP system potassium uptake protein
VTPVLVCIGAALLYGDGAITPAISVLSSVEGLTVAAPGAASSVIPVTIVILVMLFFIQSKGTKIIGQLFGPVMVVWFTTLAALGVWHIAHQPMILQAISPHHAVNYFREHGLAGAHILGSIVLCVTGGEALYADMGHFGRRPVSRTWIFFVMPALVLNYFGQGALVMHSPEAAVNPFFLMVPTGTATYALVGLSSVAAIIASQAMISGAFSLTKQAMQLGLFPRVTVKHTDVEQEGQIYIPEINLFLAVAAIMLVIFFKESSRLAAAYGIAVTGTMVITSIVFFVMCVTTRKWPLYKALPLLLLFLSFDLPFLIANLWKFSDGGYAPVLIGAGLVFVMLLWHEGRRFIAERYFPRFESFAETWPELEQEIAQRTPGTGAFLSVSDKGLPPILAHHVKRTRALHKQILLLTVVTAEVPTVPKKDRITVEPMSHGFSRVHVYFGYMEQPDVPRALHLARVRKELDFEPEDVTYYLARENLIGGAGGRMGVFLEKAFGFLQRNAVNVDLYFRIPADQVVEVGTQIDL